jgi:hypothetical protein
MTTFSLMVRNRLLAPIMSHRLADATTAFLTDLVPRNRDPAG